MDGKTQEERKEFARSGGQVGGKARANALTPDQRAEIARKAAEARWGPKKKTTKAKAKAKKKMAK